MITRIFSHLSQACIEEQTIGHAHNMILEHCSHPLAAAIALSVEKNGPHDPFGTSKNCVEKCMLDSGISDFGIFAKGD